MPAGAGPIPLERLEAAAESEDVLVDCLIDEELYWLRGDGSPDPFYDEPYISTLAEEARAAALDSGLRVLVAKGMVDVDPEEPDTVDVLGVYGLLADCRQSAMSVTRAVLDVPDESVTRYAFHRISDNLVLFEEVSADGFHDFTFQSLDSAAAALSSVFDRRRVAGTESGAHVRGEAVDRLDPNPSTERARAAYTVSVSGPFGSALTVFGTRDGVWATWSESEEAHAVVRAGSPDLFVLAADAISGRLPSSGPSA